MSCSFFSKNDTHCFNERSHDPSWWCNIHTSPFRIAFDSSSLKTASLFLILSTSFSIGSELCNGAEVELRGGLGLSYGELYGLAGGVYNYGRLGYLWCYWYNQYIVYLFSDNIYKYIYILPFIYIYFVDNNSLNFWWSFSQFRLENYSSRSGLSPHFQKKNKITRQGLVFLKITGHGDNLGIKKHRTTRSCPD